MLVALLLMLLDQPKLEERIIAGGPSDFMVARFIRMVGTNEQIGAKLAEIARDRHGVRPADGDPAQIRAQVAWLAKEWPEMSERTRGVAKVFKQERATFDPTSLNYDLDVNPGCSVVYYPGTSVEGGHAILSRNYDFPTSTFAEMVGAPIPPKARPMTADPYVIEMHPDKGYASLYIASYDLLAGCIDGINEKGLTVALLADDQAEKKRHGFAPGLTEIRLTRFVLDRCATAKEARKALESVPFHYVFTPCHYLISAPSGDSFVWEISTDLTRRSIVDGNHSPQIVTNHLLSDYDAKNLPTGNSFDRYRRLQTEIANRKGKVTPAEAAAINRCVAVPSDRAGAATLWHAVYDLADRSVKISFFLGRTPEGPERRSPYVEFKLGRS